MPVINLATISQAGVATEPFEFFTVSDVLGEDSLNAIRADFPKIDKPGLFPVSALKYGPAFARLIEEVRSPALAQLIGEKFGVNLDGLPMMITVRGQAQQKDGRIHTDTKDKVVTCLLYLNETWDTSDGRLRLLRSGDNLEDYAAEVPPRGGAFAAFRVGERSWHGHKPYVGERRYVMFNWVRSESALSRQLGRHTISAKIKKLIPAFYTGT
jgi:SM-20-related protein